MNALAVQKLTDVRFQLIAIERHYGGSFPAIKGTIQDGVRLYDLSKEFDEPSVATLLTMLIIDFCSEFNVGSKNMTVTQAQNLAIDIVTGEENKRWTLEEFALFLKRAKTGEYGTPFDRIDRGFMNEIMDKYFATDRTDAVHQIQDERDNEWKKKNIPLERSTPPMPVSEIDKKYNPPTAGNVHIPGITDNQKIHK